MSAYLALASIFYMMPYWFVVVRIVIIECRVPEMVRFAINRVLGLDLFSGHLDDIAPSCAFKRVK